MAQSIALASNFCLPGAAAMLTRSQHSGGAENSTGGHSKTHGMVTRRSALGDISNKGGAPSNNVNGGVKVHLCGDGIVCGEARRSTTSMYDCSWRVLEWQHLSGHAGSTGGTSIRLQEVPTFQQAIVIELHVVI